MYRVEEKEGSLTVYKFYYFSGILGMEHKVDSLGRKQGEERYYKRNGKLLGYAVYVNGVLKLLRNS